MLLCEKWKGVQTNKKLYLSIIGIVICLFHIVVKQIMFLLTYVAKNV